MSFDYNFPNDSLMPKWYRDKKGRSVSIEVLQEKQTVINNSITLNGIPDMFYKVVLNKINNKEMYEIPLDKEINSDQYFQVDYNDGTVYFHSSLEGKEVIIDKYYSRGVMRVYANRILFDSSNIKEMSITKDKLSLSLMQWIKEQSTNSKEIDFIDGGDFTDSPTGINLDGGDF